jgi:hypothetical protein
MSVNQHADVSSRLQATFAISVHDHWVLFLIEGIVLLVLGLIAFLIPPLATLGVTIVLGWLFLISGTMGLIATVWARQAAWILVVPGFGVAWYRRGPRSAGKTREWREFTLACSDRIFCDRRYCLSHVLAGVPSAVVWTLGMVVGQWRHPRWDNLHGASRDCSMGARIAGWH